MFVFINALLLSVLSTYPGPKLSMVYEIMLSDKINAQCESKKSPPEIFWKFFPNAWEFFSPNFTHILNVHMYARLQILIQLPATLTKLCHIKCEHPVHIVHVRKMSTISQNAFSDIFPKLLRIFNLNFTRLLNIHTYARMQIFVQLTPTVTKLCHIKCDHPACVSVDGGHSHYGGRALYGITSLKLKIIE